MIWFRKRWVVTLFMRSGERFHIRCKGCAIKRDADNSLTSISVDGGKLPFYIRLDAIDTITTRRAWL